MAKSEKPAKAAKSGKVASQKPAAEEFKYGIADLSEAVGTQSASVRVALRAMGKTKAGSAWGWNTKAEVDDLVKELKERSARAPDMTKGKPKSAKGKKKVDA
ncbi:MAG: hypothetical protein WAU17_02490 [Nitrospirales bacterium]